jgi:hypothetical protein
MFTALVSVVFGAAALSLILLAVVVVGIRQEPRGTELGSVAPTLVAVMVRRLLGVYVRRPIPVADRPDRQEQCSPDTRPAIAQSKAPTLTPGERG